MSTPLRVLIVEDRPSDAQLMLSELRQTGFEPDWSLVETESDFVAQLDSKLDVILSDYSMPQFDAMRALSLRNQCGIDVPFIIVSGSIGEDLAMDAMRQGATDYLLKDRLARLGPAVTIALEKKHLRAAKQQAERALRETLDRTRGILDTTQDPFITMDAKGRVTDWNVQAVAVFGWSRNEAIGQKVSDLIIPPRYREAHQAGLLRFLATGKGTIVNRRIEIEAQRRDGRTLPVELIVWPVRFGDVYTFNAFVRDITQRRHAEEILHERSRLSSLSSDVARALIESSALRPMLNRCVESLARNLGSAAARIWSFHEADNVLELEANSSRLREEPPGRVPVGQSLCGLIALERRPLFTNSLQTETQVSDAEWAKRERLVAFSGYPLLIDNRLLGVMEIFSRHQLSQTSLGTLGLVANQIALGIERKRTEESLRQAEGKYHSIVENAVEGIFQTTPDGRYLMANPALVRIYGFDSAEELIATVNDIEQRLYVDPDRRAEFVRLMQKDGVVTGFESQVLRKDGSDIWISENARAVRNEHGTLLFYEGTVEDISDRKRAEEALRESNQKLQLLIEASPLAIMAVDRETSVLMWNPAAEEIFGWSAAEVLGHPVPIIPKEQREVFQSQFEDELQGVTRSALELRRLCKNGTLIDVHMWTAPLHDVTGRITAILGMFANITEQKKLEEQFRQAQKMEAIGRLAGGVAHDFNNLLTVITGYSDIILDQLRSDDPFYEPIEQIKKSGERAATLTRQLLAFSRKQVLVPVMFNLNALLADMQKLLHRLIGEDVEMLIRLDPALWKITVDAGQMEQILMNLSVNARDAMPDGGQLVIETANVDLDDDYVNAHPEARLGKHVLLTVSDTGCGMDQATLSQIFEPFFTTKDSDKGTGLGLATVYGIVKQSGGHITVYSEPGIGSTFKIYLPCDRQGGLSSTVKTGIKAVPRGTETVLLVEDEEGVRTLARLILQRNGYNVLEATNGQEALQLSEQQHGPIHLLVTDVVMPQMGGRQLAERLLQSRPEMKVLYMSGYTDDAIVRHGVLSRDMPFIQKPFAADALAQTVRETLDRQGSSGSPRLNATR